MRGRKSRKELADLPDLSRSYESAKEAVAHAIHWLSAFLERPGFNVRPGSDAYLTMRRDCPYVIHDTSIPDTQILVNREYKPVGSSIPRSGAYLSYEEFTTLHVKLTAQQIQKVVSPPHERGLFDDANPPWRKKADARAYLQRLHALYALLP